MAGGSDRFQPGAASSTLESGTKSETIPLNQLFLKSYDNGQGGKGFGKTQSMGGGTYRGGGMTASGQHNTWGGL